jgi:outer membrane protein OmpA-like peptidoglycan-associated protein
MFTKLKRTVALAALLASMSVGAAHATEGWYGRADVGYSVDGALETDAGDLDFENDWSGHLGVGRGFANGFRAEGELGYRSNDIEDFPGEVTALALMANLYYDFNRDGRWQPYIGVGVGGAQVEVDGGVGPITFDSDDTVFAYQGLAGVAVGLSDRLSLDIGYRYFVAPDVGIEAVYDSGEGFDTLETEADYKHQAVTVGLRWQFAAPAAPPVVVPPTPPTPPTPTPPPAVCPTSEFVVYFEWDRSNLNEAAIQTIDAAIARARQCNVSAVAIVGHTDTSGSNAYNQGLSERRASIVRDALASRGMSAGAMTMQARGETDLARATRDGVREPLNRRTAVTISFR